LVDLFQRQSLSLEEAAPDRSRGRVSPGPGAGTTIEPPVDTLPGGIKPEKAFEGCICQGRKQDMKWACARRIDSQKARKQIDEVASFRRELSRRFEGLATTCPGLARSPRAQGMFEKRELVAGMIRKALDACEERTSCYSGRGRRYEVCEELPRSHQNRCRYNAQGTGFYHRERAWAT